MAESKAHLTTAAHTRPSLFEFIAQDSLSSLLHPSVTRIIKTLAINFGPFQFMGKWCNEFSFVAQFLLQLHYLKKFGASFSEAFYGLKRVPLKSSTLERKHIILSLIFCSVVPYLRLKLSEVAENIYFDILPHERQRRKRALLRSVIALDSGFNIALRIISFVQYIRYLSGKTDVISPFLWATDVKLVHMKEEDFQQGASGFGSYVSTAIRRGLEGTAFFVQFMNWWQRERIVNLYHLPIPPAPEISADGKKFAGICPICREKRKLETILSVSGYVFCFTCIRQYLKEHNRCPVTNLSATVNNLIRLY